MKKRFLLITASLLLTGCSITFTGQETPEGFSDGGDHSERVVEYYEGDNFETEGRTKHVLSFHDDGQGGQKDLKTFDEIKTAMTDTDTFVTNVENIKSVGQFHALKVGNIANNIDGGLKFTFSSAITSVEIVAQPRWSITYSGLAEVPTIDKNVAINANGSKYIKINDDFADIDSITTTSAKFNIESSTTLEINVVYQRIEILQINLYE